MDKSEMISNYYKVQNNDMLGSKLEQLVDYYVDRMVNLREGDTPEKIVADFPYDVKNLYRSAVDLKLQSLAKTLGITLSEQASS